MADRPQEPESLAAFRRRCAFRVAHPTMYVPGVVAEAVLVLATLDILRATCQECDTLRRQLADARAAIQDIDDHATPLAEDEDGFVTTGYLVSVGAMHRALGVAQGAAAVLRGVPANRDGDA